METIYTIGHSTYDQKYFIAMLKKYNINCIVDVRSTPYSKYAEQYNLENISFALKKEGIKYLYMGKEFGARRSDRSLYDQDGKLDFDKTSESSDFQEGVQRIQNGLKKGFRISFMCTEKNPKDCHRCILVGKAFDDMGYDIQNITEDGSIISQKEVSRQLADEYVPESNQISFLDVDVPKSYDERVKEAYHIRAKEIAYSIREEQTER